MDINFNKIHRGGDTVTRTYIFKDGQFQNEIVPTENTLVLKEGKLFINKVCKLLIDYAGENNEYVFVKYDVIIDSPAMGLYFSTHSNAYTGGTTYKQEGFITQRHIGVNENNILAMPADKYILVGDFANNYVDRVAITEIWIEKK